MRPRGMASLSLTQHGSSQGSRWVPYLHTRWRVLNPSARGSARAEPSTGLAAFCAAGRAVETSPLLQTDTGADSIQDNWCHAGDLRRLPHVPDLPRRRRPCPRRAPIAQLRSLMQVTQASPERRHRQAVHCHSPFLRPGTWRGPTITWMIFISLFPVPPLLSITPLPSSSLPPREPRRDSWCLYGGSSLGFVQNHVHSVPRLLGGRGSIRVSTE